MIKLLKIILIALVAVCIFDPADQLLGLKVPLFVTAWVVFLTIGLKQKELVISKSLLMYLMVFLLIPLISIAYYFMIGGDFINYDGFMYFKAYFFLSLAAILYSTKIDLFKPTVFLLTLLASLTVLISLMGFLNKPLAMMIHAFGTDYGIVSVGGRMYGASVLPGLLGVYFHTSEMMVLPLGYFTMKTLFWKDQKTISGLFLVMIAFAMFISTTRNNIFSSFLVPLSIFFWYSKRKVYVLFIFIIITLFIVLKMDAFSSMFDPDAPSNSFKISFMKDYIELFNDDKVFLFGQGLGSYFLTAKRGFVSVTELTYFELIRRLGLVLAIPALFLLLYPLTKLRLERYKPMHYLFIVYFFYLVMAFFNPFLMSSNGMLLLSIVLFVTFSPVAVLSELKNRSGEVLASEGNGYE